MFVRTDVSKVEEVAGLFQAAHIALKGTAAPPPQSPQSEQPSNVTHLKTCNHGVREYKEGNNKNTGKPWAGWFCPEKNKSAQCAVVWKDD